MSKYQPININDRVRCKLTNIGYAETVRRAKEMMIKIPGASLSLQEWITHFSGTRHNNDDGWSYYQIHQLMEIFGHMMLSSYPLPFTDLELIKS